MFLSGENQYRVAVKDGILFCSKGDNHNKKFCISCARQAFFHVWDGQSSMPIIQQLFFPELFYPTDALHVCGRIRRLLKVMGALMRWKRSCVLKKQSTKKMLTVSTPGSVNWLVKTSFYVITTSGLRVSLTMGNVTSISSDIWKRTVKRAGTASQGRWYPCCVKWTTWRDRP